MEDLCDPLAGIGVLIPLALVLVLAVAGCGGDDDDDSNASNTTAGGDTSTTASTEPVTLRLGYFPNVTHSPAVVGVEHGDFEDALGDNVTLELTTFNAGPAAVEAIFGGALDASFIGPNPSINAYAQSKGEAVRVVSGTASGGAYLVVKPDITSSEDLAGKTLATPQLGNTQDVALRSWLKDEGYETDTAGGGDVKILPQENAQTLDTFKAGQIDGAWVPEPWATRLVERRRRQDPRRREGPVARRQVRHDQPARHDRVPRRPPRRRQAADRRPRRRDRLHQGSTGPKPKPSWPAGIEKASGKPIAPELVTASFDEHRRSRSTRCRRRS